MAAKGKFSGRTLLPSHGKIKLAILPISFCKPGNRADIIGSDGTRKQLVYDREEYAALMEITEL